MDALTVATPLAGVLLPFAAGLTAYVVLHVRGEPTLSLTAGAMELFPVAFGCGGVFMLCGWVSRWWISRALPRGRAVIRERIVVACGGLTGAVLILFAVLYEFLFESPNARGEVIAFAVFAPHIYVIAVAVTFVLGAVASWLALRMVRLWQR